MLSFKIYIALFVCFTIIKCLDFQKLMSDISTHVNVILSTEPHIFNITINQKIVSTIFMFITDNKYVLDINKKMCVLYWFMRYVCPLDTRHDLPF